MGPEPDQDVNPAVGFPKSFDAGHSSSTFCEVRSPPFVPLRKDRRLMAYERRSDLLLYPRAQRFGIF